MADTVSAFWWRGVVNWGDNLTPLLLKRFANLDTTWANPNEAQVACVGSILGNLVKSDYTGTILGSGKLFENARMPTQAKILALRGPLTALNVPGNFALGDPGLIADELVDIETKEYNLGIVPHWSDKTLATDPRFTQYNPVIINPHDDALTVLQTIGKCKKIVSSSLHGLIVADAFNIPRRFEASGKWQQEGGDFKVRDHNANVGIVHEIGVTQEANWNRVADIKNSLYDAFNEFRSIIKGM